MAGTPNFTGVAPRQAYVVAADISGAGTNYKIVGRRVADSSLDFNTGEETDTDILGITDTDITGMEESQEFEFPITSEDYDLYAWAKDIYFRRAWAEFKGVRGLQIHAYEGNTGAYSALEFDSCTFVLQSLGGAGEGGRLNVSFILRFGGETRIGTVNTARLGETITFTPTI